MQFIRLSKKFNLACCLCKLLLCQIWKCHVRYRFTCGNCGLNLIETAMVDFFQYRYQEIFKCTWLWASIFLFFFSFSRFNFATNVGEVCANLSQIPPTCPKCPISVDACPVPMVKPPTRERLRRAFSGLVTELSRDYYGTIDITGKYLALIRIPPEICVWIPSSFFSRSRLDEQGHPSCRFGPRALPCQPCF